MSMLTQGTQVFVLAPTVADPTIFEVLVVPKATQLNPGGAPAEQIEDTGLEDFNRTYLAGLRTPGQATLTINADPRNAAHVRLYDLANANPPAVLKWAVGWSDGVAPPTVANGAKVFTLPTTRTWFTFEGYLSDFPFDFSMNSVVSTAVAIQRSGGSAWQKKVIA